MRASEILGVLFGPVLLNEIFVRFYSGMLLGMFFSWVMGPWGGGGA